MTTPAWPPNGEKAEINSHVAPIATRLLWQGDLDGWNILAFEHLDDRHPNLAPGSPDLPKIADTLTRLGQIQAPDLPLRRLEDRWTGLADDSELALLAGEHLLRTDLNPTTSSSVSTPTSSTGPGPPLGAAWIDPACAVDNLWLIAEGHIPPPPKIGRARSRPSPKRRAPASAPSS